MSILSSLCLSPLISFYMNSQSTESKLDFFSPPRLSLEHGWSYKIDQKWLLMTPVFYSRNREKMATLKSLLPPSLLIVHFNERWNIQYLVVDITAPRPGRQERLIVLCFIKKWFNTACIFLNVKTASWSKEKHIDLKYTITFFLENDNW